MNNELAVPNSTLCDAPDRAESSPRYYVVMEQFYDYNDEFYFAPGGEFTGQAARIFVRLSDAIMWQRVLTFANLRGLDLATFGYEPENVFSDVPAAMDLFNAFGWWDATYPQTFWDRPRQIPTIATDDQLEALIPLLTIQLFYVQEVDG